MHECNVCNNFKTKSKTEFTIHKMQCEYAKYISDLKIYYDNDIQRLEKCRNDLQASNTECHGTIERLNRACEYLSQEKAKVEQEVSELGHKLIASEQKRVELEEKCKTELKNLEQQLKDNNERNNLQFKYETESFYTHQLDRLKRQIKEYEQELHEKQQKIEEHKRLNERLNSNLDDVQKNHNDVLSKWEDERLAMLKRHDKKIKEHEQIIQSKDDLLAEQSQNLVALQNDNHLLVKQYRDLENSLKFLSEQKQHIIELENKNQQIESQYINQINSLNDVHRVRCSELEKKLNEQLSLISLLEKQIKAEQSNDEREQLQQELDNLKNINIDLIRENDDNQQKIYQLLKTQENDRNHWEVVDKNYSQKTQHLARQCLTSKKQFEKEQELHSILQIKYDQLTKTYDKLVIDHSNLCNNNNQFIVAEQNQKQTLANEIKSLKSELDICSGKYQTALDEIAKTVNIKQQYDSIKNYSNKLETDIETKVQDYNRLQQEYSSIQTKYNNILQTYKNAQDDMEEKQQKIDNLEREIKTLNTNNTSLTTKISALETELENLSNSKAEQYDATLNELRDAHAIAVKECQKQSLNNQHVTLTLKNSQMINDQLRGQLVDHENTIQEFKEIISDIETRCTTKDKRIYTLTQDCDSLQATINDYTARIEQLQHQCESLEAQMQTEKKSKIDFEKEQEVFKRQYLKLEVERNNINDKYMTLLNSITVLYKKEKDLKYELDTTRSELQNYSDHDQKLQENMDLLDTVKDQNEKLNHTIKQLEDNIKRLEQSLDGCHKQETSLKDQITMLNRYIDEYKSINDKATIDLDAKQNKINEIMEQNTKLRKELEIQNIELCKDKVREQQVLLDLENKLKEQTDISNYLKDKLDYNESSYTALQQEFDALQKNHSLNERQYIVKQSKSQETVVTIQNSFNNLKREYEDFKKQATVNEQSIRLDITNEYDQKLQYCQVELDQHKNINQKNKAIIENLNKQLDSIQKDHQDMVNINDSLLHKEQVRYKQLEEQYESDKRKHDKYIADLDMQRLNHIDEINQLTSQINQQKMLYDDMINAHRTKMDETVRQYEAKIDFLTKTIADAKNVTLDSGNANDQLNNRINMLLSTIDDNDKKHLKALQHQQALNNNQQHIIDELETKLVILNEKLEYEINNSLKLPTVHDVQKLELQIEQLENDLKQKNAIIQQLQHVIDTNTEKTKTEYKYNIELNTDFNKNLEQLKQSLKDKELQIQRLETDMTIQSQSHTKQLGSYVQEQERLCGVVKDLNCQLESLKSQWEVEKQKYRNSLLDVEREAQLLEEKHEKDMEDYRNCLKTARETCRQDFERELTNGLYKQISSELTSELTPIVKKELEKKYASDIKEKLLVEMREPVHKELSNELTPIITTDLKNKLKPVVMDNLEKEYSNVVEKNIEKRVMADLQLKLEPIVRDDMESKYNNNNNEQIDSLLKLNKSLDEANKELQSKNSQIMSQLRELNDQYKELQSKYSELELGSISRHEYNEEISKLTQELNQYKDDTKKLGDLISTINDNKMTRENLLVKLEQAEKLYNDTKHALKLLKTEHSQCMSPTTITAMEEQIDDLEMNLSVQKQYNKEVSLKLNEIQMELNRFLEMDKNKPDTARQLSEAKLRILDLEESLKRVDQTAQELKKYEERIELLTTEKNKLTTLYDKVVNYPKQTDTKVKKLREESLKTIHEYIEKESKTRSQLDKTKQELADSLRALDVCKAEKENTSFKLHQTEYSLNDLKQNLQERLDEYKRSMDYQITELQNTIATRERRIHELEDKLDKHFN
jgi:chromosome segregation ATPase